MFARVFGVIRSYWIFSVLSIGTDDFVESESDPLQQISELQQGKQFDHIHLIPLLLKSNILFNLYVCMLLCQMLNCLIEVVNPIALFPLNCSPLPQP